mmetsp:Transcript_20840/g.31046  ORF Transcript_20840/g.31046 Transcript_20840/m.31046 type:complete len:109 (-) Transcript_20840:20-346(-)
MSSGKGKHTILLSQSTKNRGSRRWDDFETVSAAMNALCQMFERELQRRHPERRQITYDVKDLTQYIDSFTEFCAMIFDPATAAYQPHSKDWIKKRVVRHLKSVAAQRR